MVESASLISDTGSTPSITEQLGKAFTELESHEETSSNTMVPWKEIEEHFLNLENSFKEKLHELAEKEKELEEKESENRKLLVDREAEVSAREQAFLDRLQELKDSAVSAIMEAGSKYKMASPEPSNVGENAEMKVSSPSNGDDPISLLKEKAPDFSGSHTKAMPVEVTPHPELMKVCEQMNVKGLLKYISDNRKDLSALREEIPVALKSAPEPARLVLDSLEDFYPLDSTSTHQGNKQDLALMGLRRSCVLLMESVAPLLVETEKDHSVSSEIKQQAKRIADEWKSKFAGEVILDAANGSSLEAQAFLQLLATYGIASEFDEDELCKFVLAVSCRRQTIELCRSLSLIHKMPGLIEALINSGRQIDAVHFVQAFQLVERFPPVPLLRTYLKDLRRNTQGSGANAEVTGIQNDANAQELAALRAVSRCIEEYKLEAEYPLSPLQKRVVQLEKAKTDRKRIGDQAKPRPNRPRANGAYEASPQQRPRATGAYGYNGQPPPRPMFGGRGGGYHEGLEQFPYHAGPAAYEYAPQSMYGQQQAGASYDYAPQSMYGQQQAGVAQQQAGTGQPYYYQEEWAPGTGNASSTYGNYAGSGLQANAQSAYIYQDERPPAPSPNVSAVYAKDAGAALQFDNGFVMQKQ